jgi:plasmid maintenance system antidote protein VapI
MKSPPHPGEIVADNLAELGVTVKDAAEALGVTRQQLHKVDFRSQRHHPGNGLPP